MNIILKIMITWFLVMLFFLAVSLYLRKIKRDKVKALANNYLEVSPTEFFNLRTATLHGRGRRNIPITDDYIGVYILYNKTKNMYYVGQAKKVMQRVNAHFTGHGNGDVYADYKYGDEFTIKTIALSSSGYNSLDKLERDTIDAYNAYSTGYNKTRGNR